MSFVHFTPVPFSRGRVPIYLSRIIFPGIVVTTAAPPKNIDFHSMPFTPIPSPSPSTSPDLYLLILALSKMDLRPVFPPPRPVHTEYTTHVTRNFRALDRRSDLPHGQNNTSGWFIRPPRRERVFAACAPANITSLSYFAIPFYLR